jgi:hypothetical protein
MLEIELSAIDGLSDDAVAGVVLLGWRNIPVKVLGSGVCTVSVWSGFRCF